MASSHHAAFADSCRPLLPLISALAFGLSLPATGHTAPGDTTLVSLSTASSPAPGRCGYGTGPHQCVSGDGRYVVFESYAALVPEDTNGVSDIYLRDRVLNATRRISIAADGTSPNGGSGSPAISADGRFAAFSSIASNLVPNDTNGLSDVFVRDVAAGTTERVNLTVTGAQQTTDQSWGPWISADGRYIVFDSTAPLVPGDDSAASQDVYLRDRLGHATIRVSVRSDGTALDGGYSGGGTISDDGRFVAFTSAASNLVEGDVNEAIDMFVRDMQTGTIERASVGSDTASAGEGGGGAISGDGRYVAFYSHLRSCRRTPTASWTSMCGIDHWGRPNW
jgi:Tol biopolymer transport system component